MKRFICMMLTLIMLVSLVPMAALPASAATFATSEAAITVLKNILTFRGTCYQVDGTDECRIGYGTVCTGKHEVKNGVLTNLDPDTDHKINQYKADLALRDELTKMDKKVNSFATSNALSVNQNKFDALSVLSYLYGTAWMNGNGTVKTALKNNASSTELLNAINGVTGNVNRSKIIVNMYKNNVYSNDLPSNYSSVTYNANGGTMPQGKTYTMQFDATLGAAHTIVPTRNGYKFMGWYFGNGQTFTRRSTRLSTSCAGQTLYALWQSNSVGSENVGSYADHPTVNFVLDESELPSHSIYDYPSPDTGKKIDVVDDDEVTIDREYIRYDGSRWGRIKGTKGWVRISGGSSTESSDSDTICVTVTNSYVNYREQPTVFGKNLGKFNQGKKLYVYGTSNADGYLWGEVAETQDGEAVGWIALRYTNWNSVKDGSSSSSSDSGSGSSDSPYVAQATITYNGYVNLRNGAGTANRIIGSLAKNETVYITEIKTVNGHQWGNIGTGWFCMTYANVTMLSGNSDVSNEGSKAYTFTGTTKDGIVTYVDTTINSNKTEDQPKVGKRVSIITMRQSGDETWVKIGWNVTEDKKTVTKYGWVPISPVKERASYSWALTSNSSPLALNPLDFQVVAESVTVRTGPNSAASSITKLNKGYQFEIDTIVLMNEQIWGAVDNSHLTGGDGDGAGWVNLASKYVKRTDLIEEEQEEQEENANKKVATVINTDKVNVRAGSAVTALKVGELRRGAVANVLDEDNGWYLLDVDVDNDSDTESWVSGDYLDVRSGSSSNGNINAPSSTGIGVVANTYAGVNVRSGAGTANPSVGKLLPGTRVNISETKFVGSVKWGKTEQGWVCMDYITMITEAPTVPETPSLPNGGTSVGDYDDVEKTTTTAVYTGYAISDESGKVQVWATTQHHNEGEGDDKINYVVRELNYGDPVTIYELLKVTERVESGEGDDGNTTETVVTSYWARVNDGYIRNPENCIGLDALDEQTHTLVGSDTLRVREMENGQIGKEIGKIEKGDKVDVTSLRIFDDKVWGKIEYEGEVGWIRLDYMAEGAIYEQPKVETPPAPPAQPPIGDTGSAGNGGFVSNSGGYKYTGKIIRSDGVKIRNSPSTTAKVNTTKDKGASIVIYETTIADNRAWGRCDAGWVYLYYVDMEASNFVDVRVVYNDNTIIYSDMNMSETVGTYSKMAVIEITEIVGKMAHTDLGWVSTDDLL